MLASRSIALSLRCGRRGVLALTSPSSSSSHRHRSPAPTTRCWSNNPSSSSSSSSGSRPSSSAVLSQTTSFLRNLDNGAEIFLVGTAHVSKMSAEEVRDMITLVKPDVVMVELCQQRGERLRSGSTVSDQEFLREALGQLFRPGSHFGQQLLGISLKGMYRVLHSLGMEVGGEFKAAMLTAEQSGAKLVYGDRNVEETMAKLAAAIRIQDVFKIMSGGGPRPPQNMVDYFENSNTSDRHSSSSSTSSSSTGSSRIEAQVEAMKTRRMARQMSDWLREINPDLATALIDERDEHMVHTLRKLRGRVVGVVGLAHLDGIERRWELLQPGGGGVVAAAPSSSR